MAIYAAVDLTNSSQTPRPESPFQVGDSQLKAIRELAKIFDAETKIPNRDSLPIHLSQKTNNISKLPKVEDQMYPPQRVDPEKESKYREQKLPIPTQATPPSAAKREKYTKNQWN